MPDPQPRPLFSVERGLPALESAVERTSAPAGRKWGRWFSPVEPKNEVIAAPPWVLRRNTGLAERTVRRGDLRASILATLRLDQGQYPSESALANHLSASRIAVRRSLDALETEGFALRHPPRRGRGIRIALKG